MTPFTFIHAADLHLGGPFSGLRSVSPEVAEAVDRATYRAFDNILNLALESGAAFVLFAGDVYDGADRNLRAQLRFRDGLRRLDAAEIPALVIHGNHDHLSGTQARLEWPENVHVFPARPSAPQILFWQGEKVAAVYGTSYPQRDVRESLLPHYRPRKEDEGLFRIGLLHGTVGVQPGHESYAPCTLPDLAAVGMDYWALGHVHSFQVLQAAEPAVVYPGTPQGLSPREDGRPHGCCRVSVDSHRVPTVEFVRTDDVRWRTLTLSIEGLATEDDLLDRIAGGLEKARAEEGVSVIARVRLTGRGPLHRLLQREEHVQALAGEFQREVQGEPFVWLDRLDVDTRPGIDLEQRRQGEDLLGDFLRICREARSDAVQRASLLQALEDLYGRRELRDVLPDPAERLDAWIERAESLGADLLLGTEDAGVPGPDPVETPRPSRSRARTTTPEGAA